MKALVLSTFLVAGVVGLASVSVADQTETSGAFVKDSVITTKVKAKLAERHLSTLTKIKVDTDRDGVVWLSGTAPTRDAKDLAVALTKDTDGVRSVHDNIVIAE